jgi:chemotaxis signal transduction protein
MSGPGTSLHQAAGVLGLDAFLIVRAGGGRYGLPLASVREVVDLAPVRPVPTRVRALRGVMPLRERFVSLVHLGALLTGEEAPAAPGDAAVVVMVAGARVALEVDEVEAVADRSAVVVGEAPAAWARNVWRVGQDLVTVLDLGVLAERISERGSGNDAAG